MLMGDAAHAVVPFYGQGMNAVSSGLALGHVNRGPWSRTGWEGGPAAAKKGNPLGFSARALAQWPGVRLLL